MFLVRAFYKFVALEDLQSLQAELLAEADSALYEQKRSRGRTHALSR